MSNDHAEYEYAIYVELLRGTFSVICYSFKPTKPETGCEHNTSIALEGTSGIDQLEVRHLNVCAIDQE